MSKKAHNVNIALNKVENKTRKIYLNIPYLEEIAVVNNRFYTQRQNKLKFVKKVTWHKLKTFQKLHLKTSRFKQGYAHFTYDFTFYAVPFILPVYLQHCFPSQANNLCSLISNFVEDSMNDTDVIKVGLEAGMRKETKGTPYSDDSLRYRQGA